jgi:hypothetical protein
VRVWKLGHAWGIVQETCEAHTLAFLTDPNVAHIHGLEESGGAECEDGDRAAVASRVREARSTSVGSAGAIQDIDWTTL